MRFETVRELVVCKRDEIFLVTRVLKLETFVFQSVNSIRGHESSLLVLLNLRKCFRGDETSLI